MLVSETCEPRWQEQRLGSFRSSRLRFLLQVRPTARCFKNGARIRINGSRKLSSLALPSSWFNNGRF
jgi:hypothetical protein